MKVKFSPLMPFLMALTVYLDQQGRESSLDEDDLVEEQGLEIALPEAHEAAFNVRVTVGLFDHPTRQALVEVEQYLEDESLGLFTLILADQGGTEMFRESLAFEVNGDNPAGAGQVVAQFIWKYLMENAIPDTTELPAQLQHLS